LSYWYYIWAILAHINNGGALFVISVRGCVGEMSKYNHLWYQWRIYGNLSIIINVRVSKTSEMTTTTLHVRCFRLVAHALDRAVNRECLSRYQLPPRWARRISLVVSSSQDGVLIGNSLHEIVSCHTRIRRIVLIVDW